MFFKDLYVSELKLYSESKPEGETWTPEMTNSTGIWPDKSVSVFDYAPTTVYTFDGSSYLIDLDMNRKTEE